VKVPQGGEWNEMRGPSTGAGIMQRFNGWVVKVNIYERISIWEVKISGEKDRNLLGYKVEIRGWFPRKSS
jgi:hypothetical protein